ncbi:hypothetical protein BRADI_4g04232v3 [Brachypodium distachyon]|uniref:Reverse transcriptase zinc-binding domain-containing protein n=1 Tax=Brachypodium distachyon TaxID=15368 RepID=A0A0Q3EF10_BRADI|nr:hypothetical protein BRADI_4g04232v3 [Brachypodium distachyon]
MKKPLECAFCSEQESVRRLFFDCVVAKHMWFDVALLFQISIHDFESLARHWIRHKTMAVFNLVPAAVLWGLWKCCNDIVFNNVLWINIKHVWGHVLRNIKGWMTLLAEPAWEQLALELAKILELIRRPLLLQ